ncbi:MAG: hypothetical protein CMI60_23715 [Parvibaculum sp.]|nr:hypothetical protein [Parvibaculum sp.]
MKSINATCVMFSLTRYKLANSPFGARASTVPGLDWEAKKMLENHHNISAVTDYESAAYSLVEDVEAPKSLNPAVSKALKLHRDDFLRYLQANTRNRDDAEDILQDFCVKVLLKSDQIRDPHAPVGWLWIVLKSVLADHFRQKNRQRNLLLDFAAEQEIENTSPSPAYVSMETHRGMKSVCFQRQFSKLKPEYAKAVFWVDLRGEPQKEVASKLRISAGNLRIRLYRGRVALKHMLTRACAVCKQADCSVNQFSNTHS